MKLSQLKLVMSACALASLGFVAGCSQTTGKDFAHGEYDYQHNDYGKAFPELLKSAQAGNPRAQYAIGYMYYHGYGVSRDAGTARYWMVKAAKQGYQPAISALDIINSAGGSGTMLQPAHSGGGSGGYTGGSSGAGGEGNSEPRQVPPPPQKTQYRVQDAATHAGQSVDKAAIEKASTPMSDSADSNSLYEEQDKAYGTTQSHNTIHSVPGSQAHKTYAVQLYGDYSRAAAEQFIRHRALSSAMVATMENHGRHWYVVLEGKYPSRMAAESALTHLPAKLQALHPWVRPLNS